MSRRIPDVVSTETALGHLGVAQAGLERADATAPADDDHLRFAQGLELVMVRVYQVALPLVSSLPASQAAAAFMRHHAAHAVALAKAPGGRLVTPNKSLLGELMATVGAAKTEREALGALFDLENALAATYQYLTEHLTTDAAVRQASLILPVEGQHAVVWGTALERELKEIVPAFQQQNGHYDPSRYPVA